MKHSEEWYNGYRAGYSAAKRSGNSKRAKITAAMVNDIRKLYDEKILSTREIGFQFGISAMQVSRIGRRKAWCDV